MIQLRKIMMTAAVLFLAAGIAKAVDAKSNWENHCAKCHGVDGRGQTNLGRKLHIGDYTDPKVHEGLEDSEMLHATMEGVKYGKKEQMPGYKDRLSQDECIALVAYVRSMKK